MSSPSSSTQVSQAVYNYSLAWIDGAKTWAKSISAHAKADCNRAEFIVRNAFDSRTSYHLFHHHAKTPYDVSMDQESVKNALLQWVDKDPNFQKELVNMINVIFEHPNNQVYESLVGKKTINNNNISKEEAKTLAANKNLVQTNDALQRIFSSLLLAHYSELLADKSLPTPDQDAIANDIKLVVHDPNSAVVTVNNMKQVFDPTYDPMSKKKSSKSKTKKAT